MVEEMDLCLVTNGMSVELVICSAHLVPYNEVEGCLRNLPKWSMLSKYEEGYLALRLLVGNQSKKHPPAFLQNTRCGAEVQAFEALSPAMTSSRIRGYG